MSVSIFATPTSAIPHIRPLVLVASLAGACRCMPGLLLILLVAQLLDGAHCAEHHLGRQLCMMRCHRALLAARIPVGIPIQARIRVGVRARIGHVIVVQIATAAALMRHLRSRARVSVSVPLVQLMWISIWIWIWIWILRILWIYYFDLGSVQLSSVDPLVVVNARVQETKRKAK